MNNLENLKSNLSLKLKLERTKRALSQEKLAALANISVLTVSGIERKLNYPSIETLAQIADALEIKLCDLLNFDQ
ncbi:putative uncharacterized protein [Brachyspira sp. CAG:484]|nr:putative uncharacterized protein [Brachyspira sp. CAG:484]